MSAVITELANFSLSAFYDNRTWLTQANWQAYFGGSLPSGVIVDGGLTASGQYYTNALALQAVNASYKGFRAGKTIADGIFGSYDANTNIPVIKNSEVDRLIVARVYLLAGYMKLVSKTKIAADAGYTPAVYAAMLLRDESLGCERSETYYEIPLLYEIYGSDSYDLRRLYYIPGKVPPFLKVAYNGANAADLDPDAGVLYGQGYVNVYGGMCYDIEIDSSDTSTALAINPVPMCSEKPITVYIKNNSAVDVEIRLPRVLKSLSLSYEWIDNWSMVTGYLYRDLVAGDKMALILTPYKSETDFGYMVANKGSSGGAIDPEDYYTKTEMNVFLAAKADTSYVDEQLALKANSSALGALAYLSTVSYTTQVTDKPTLGTLAGKNKASLTADVSGILPIANGGTGASSLDGIINAVVGTKTYYVNASSGNDNNDGTSSAPFKTLGKAIASCGYLLPCQIYARGTFLENISVPNGKHIKINAWNASITITGYITVDGGKLELTAVSTDYAITISGSHQYGTIYATNGGQVILHDGLRVGISIVNSYTPANANKTKEGFGVYANNNSLITMLLENGGGVSINAYNGMGSRAGSNIIYDSGTTITYTYLKGRSISYGMLNSSTETPT